MHYFDSRSRSRVQLSISAIAVLSLREVKEISQVPPSLSPSQAVNHALGKNMIGAFYQPQCVIIDTDTLNSLPDRELASGIAEIVKYGLIRYALRFLPPSFPPSLLLTPVYVHLALPVRVLMGGRTISHTPFQARL